MAIIMGHCSRRDCKLEICIEKCDNCGALCDRYKGLHLMLHGERVMMKCSNCTLSWGGKLCECGCVTPMNHFRTYYKREELPLARRVWLSLTNR